jgi:hypothetical protein
MKFINETLEYKNISLKTCLKIKGSQLEKDLKILSNLDVTIESNRDYQFLFPSELIDYTLILVG